MYLNVKLGHICNMFPGCIATHHSRTHTRHVHFYRKQMYKQYQNKPDTLIIDNIHSYSMDNTNLTDVYILAGEDHTSHTRYIHPYGRG